MCEWVKVTSVKSFEKSVELDGWMDGYRDKQVMTNEPDSVVVDKEQKAVEGWTSCCGCSKSKESSRADETLGEDVVVRDGINGPVLSGASGDVDPSPPSPPLPHHHHHHHHYWEYLGSGR